MPRKRKALNPDQPLLHPDHPRPVTRRDFLATGLLSGAGIVIAPTLLSVLTSRPANALSQDLLNDIQTYGCSIGSVGGAGKIPFIAFDLAGGANMVGSNVLVGQQGGQLDFLNTAGYNKQGLPGDMLPSQTDPVTGLSFTATELGLAFHRDSAFFRGIMNRVSLTTAANINGAVIPARSDNDTGNNPHNPMYGIAKAGAEGELLTLIGSENSESGGNSMAPVMMIDPEIRPTKIDRTSDATGLVDTGELVNILNQNDAVAVMESLYRLSDQKMGLVDPKLGGAADDAVRNMIRCGYIKTADIAEKFGDPASINPSLDPDIVGPAGIFTQAEFDNENQFEKTAAVMKLVINGFSGAGTIEMGGYDYHGDGRASAEIKDFRAGNCMGACLEYAARRGVPLMMYVMSDGSLDSDNATVDNSIDGRGKFDWDSDNSSTAASFFLVYNPNGRPVLNNTGAGAAAHQQLGWFRADGSVETASSPAANNVNLLVETVILNYMALHGEQGNFGTVLPNHGLGNATLQDSLTAFNPIVNGII